MDAEKKALIEKVVNYIYRTSGAKLDKEILEYWGEDLEEKSINQIEHAFKRYRTEYQGWPNLKQFLDFILSYERPKEVIGQLTKEKLTPDQIKANKARLNSIVKNFCNGRGVK